MTLVKAKSAPARRRRTVGAILAAALGVTACATPLPAALTDPGTVTRGEVQLTCQLSCLWGWLSNLPQLKAFDENDNWRELGDAVTQLNFRNDLAYYYLGRAAAGQGAMAAAERYYAAAAALARSSAATDRCDGTSENCNGVNVAAAAEAGRKAAALARTTPAAGDDWVNPPVRRAG
jgi:ATP/maltotriose-dependent transcriptional regulator MalT